MGVPSERSASPAALRVVRVSGDPRAMGFAQGRAVRDEIRAALGAAGATRRGRMPLSLRPLVSGPVLGAGMGRELVRHYPHLSERIQGIARGAGASIESLMALFVRAAEGRVEPTLSDPAPAAARAGDDALVCRPLARSVADPVVRHSRPEVGFASVELTLPWLATSLVGVNEPGLAVAVAPVAPPTRATAPSVLLLVQECLQRFHDVAGGVDWCRKRPASGAASIVLADAAGRVAVVDVRGPVRELRRTDTGVVTAGGCDDRHAALRKALETADPAAVAAPEIGTRVVASPGERSLRVWLDASGEPAVFTVDRD